ncbi:MAG: hypothetical protein OXL98_09790, partial [Acidimicrobiaceae bacterium]|nr:hypothetical protein [Acidimicrobiaceae bacterium]
TPDYDRVTVLDGPDHESPTVSLGGRQSPIYAGEPVTFYLSADHAFKADTVVTYELTADGGVVAAADLGEQQITVPAGARDQFITVPTLSTNSGQDRTITMRLARGDYTREHYTRTALQPDTATWGTHIATGTVRDQTPWPRPVAQIASTGDITEGGTATFTARLSKPVDSWVTVPAHTRQIGNYGAALQSQHKLRGAFAVSIPINFHIPPGQTEASRTVSTVDDSTDEPDGSITLFILFSGMQYARGASVEATVIVKDNDDPPRPEVSITADENSIGEGEDAAFTVTASPAPTSDLDVSVTVTQSGDFGAATGQQTVTISGGATSAALTVPTTDDSAVESDGSVTASIDADSAYTVASSHATATVTVADDDVSEPTASITAGKPVTEGGDACFAVTLRPAPTALHYVRFSLTQDGDFLRFEYGDVEVFGTNRISGSAQWCFSTLDDGVDEPDGSITVTITDPGVGYTVSATQGHASVPVADNDDGPPGTPEINITSAIGGTEGDTVTFTLTATPAPAADLAVSVTATTAGDFGFGVLPASVTVPTSGSATVSIATADDQTDEPDGSVTLTVNAGSGYTVGSTPSETVTVADDDATSQGLNVHTVDPDVIATVRALAAQTQHGAAHVNRWNRVLVAFGEHDGTGVTGGAMTAAQAQEMANRYSSPVWDQVVAELTALEAVPQLTPPTPEVNVTGASGASEGGSVSFTLTASPAPASDLTVSVTAAASGDFGFGALPASVTIPASGSATVTVTTTDDDVDEPDGSVTLTVDAGGGYTVGAQSSQTVDVADDDDPVVEEQTGYTVDPAVVAKVGELASQTQHGTAHVNRWNRVLVAFGEHDGTGVTGDAMTAAEAQQMAEAHSSPVWDEVVTELTALEAASQNTPPPTPEVSVTAGGGVTEGAAATFTLTASPAPASALAVSVTVSQSGDYGAATGRRTVSIPASGSVTVTVATTNDGADEADGSVTATVEAGGGYTVSASQGAATVSVADDDAPVVVPVVSISAGDGVTEGGSLTFTLSASPAPAADLDVTVTVATVGDYGVAAGSRTVTIPASGAATLTIATTGDQTDEADGSVTATLVDGTGYDLGSSVTATVSVADDDAPVVVPVVSISGGGGVTEGGAASFTVSASPSPASAIDVTVTVAASGDFGAATGRRTVRVTPGHSSVTFTVATSGDQADEPDGSVTVTLVDGADYDLGTSKAATVAVADDDDPPVVIEQDQTDGSTLTACEGRPELLISSPEASRSDGTVDFEVSLSCIPSSSPTILLSPVRDGHIGQNRFVNLTADQATATVTVTIGGEDQLALALVWSSGLANRYAQGTVTFSD